MRPHHRRIEAGASSIATPRIGSIVLSCQQRRATTRPPSARGIADWCDELARQVRSGSSLRDALSHVVPADIAGASATAPMRLAIERGSSVGDAVDRVDHVGIHLRLALSVIATASRIGGPCAAAIDRTAMSLRQRAADIDERSAQAAQARLSTHVMTAVPLLMLALLFITDHNVRHAAISPVGAGAIGAGLVLNATGWWWMRRIVRSDA